MLSDVARELISDPGNAVFVSVVSLWEIRLKQSLGKPRVPNGLEETLAADHFEILPLTATPTILLASLPWHHRDPFDRMLVAQAMSERFTLLTGDSMLAAYGGVVRTV